MKMNAQAMVSHSPEEHIPCPTAGDFEVLDLPVRGRSMNWRPPLEISAQETRDIMKELVLDSVDKTVKDAKGII